MYSIEATNAKNWRWISGLFEGRAAAEAFLQLVPAPSRSMQQIVEISAQTYPVFIIEDKGFEYGDLAFIQERLKTLRPRGDEDHIHMNVYAVLEDFAPKVPGRDNMGALMHWHITDWSLVPPRSEVLDEELRELAGNA